MQKYTDMAWNVFKHCSILRALGSVMIFVVLGIIGVSYYAVVVVKYGPALFHGGLDSIIAFLGLLLFHSLLVMLLWSYFSVVLTDPGGPPPNWIPKLDEEMGDTDPLVGSDNGGVSLGSNQSAMLIGSKDQGIRFCQKCNQFKPPRCHHCSVCRRCILKMDHHCVWVVNCVGAFNYKYFLLFLFYTFLETTLVTVSLLPVFIALFTDDEVPGSPGTFAATFITFVLNLAFLLSILGFLIMHVKLLAGNTTTIEAFEKKTTPKWRFDLGWKINCEQVLGKNKKYWLIPAYSKEDLEWMPSFHSVEYLTRPDSDDL